MTTACGALVNRSFLRAPIDYGYSDEAVDIRQNLHGIWNDYGLTVTVGRRFDGMVEAIWEAAKDAANEDWDGYGAKPCDPASLFRAYQFVDVMPESVPVPDVVVDPEGMIELEWYAGARSVFSVTIKSDGSLVYAGLFGRNRAYGRESVEEEIPREIFQFIQRVYSR